MSWNAPGNAPGVSVSAPVVVVGYGPGGRRLLVPRPYASAPALALDDSTVRPRLKRKRGLSVSESVWGQGCYTTPRYARES